LSAVPCSAIHVAVAISDGEIAAGLNPVVEEVSPQIAVETKLALVSNAPSLVQNGDG